MQRLRRLIFPLALLAALAVAVSVTVEDSAAELDNQVFTSRPDRVRLIVPRGWRASDQQSYPGVLLWMARSQPQGQITLTAEAVTQDLFCSWPVACRTQRGIASLIGASGVNLSEAQREAAGSIYTCALRRKLDDQHMRIGPTQAGPKENETAGIPSVWFEYDDGKHFLRQAIAFSADRAFSLVLSAPSSDARAAHARAFEQALRTMQLLSPEETSRAEGSGSGAPAPPSAARGDAGPVDGAVLDGGAFESAPAAVVSTIGPCRESSAGH